MPEPIVFSDAEVDEGFIPSPEVDEIIASEGPMLAHEIAVPLVTGPVEQCLPEYEPDSLYVLVPINQPPEVIEAESIKPIIVPAYN